MELEETLKLLPDKPGVYLHKGDKGQILYVGKAKILKNRVRSYFVNSNQHTPKTLELVSQIRDVEWIITRSEFEALVLEDQLIKTHKPKYNIRLKDNKTYPYFKLSVQEMYPRLRLTRELKKDGSKYFGPYVSVFDARKTWSIIKKSFPLRQSHMPLDGTKTYRPCLNFQMKRCLAPCSGEVEQGRYRKIVNQVEQLLKGNYEELITGLSQEMEKLATEMKFEEAATLRDQVNVVKRTLKKQHQVATKQTDRDVLALFRTSGFAGIEVLFIRNGIFLSSDFFFFKNGQDFDDQELLRSTLSRLYISGDLFIPNEILLAQEYEDASMLEQYLSEQRKAKVSVSTGQRGEKRSLVDLALKNAEEHLKLRMEGAHSDELIMEEVRKALHLKELPFRVEAFDISNISGTNTVASMVVSEGNRALKSDYRKFKIKTVDGPNDFESMKEVLGRRYRKALTGESPLPDLILIDGGRGQLSSAIKVLSDLGIDLDEVDIIGLAKGRSDKRANRDKGEDDYEYVVKPNQKNEIRLKKNSNTLHFLQRIRDESHRFAITFHRQLRGKRATKSDLENISGIGPQKRKTLLQELGSLTKIQEATPEILEALAGISSTDAQAIYDYFHPQSEPQKQEEPTPPGVKTYQLKL